MCGRVSQSSGPMRYGIVEGLDVPTAAFTTVRPAGMPRRARSSWSSGAIIRPVRCRSIRCAGVSFPPGARTRKAAAGRDSGPLADLREAYRRRRCIPRPPWPTA